MNTPNCSKCGSPNTSILSSNGQFAIIECFDGKHKTKINEPEFVKYWSVKFRNRAIRELKKDLKVLFELNKWLGVVKAG